MKRSLSSQDLAYEFLANIWQNMISNYDTQRRIETLLNDWLPPGTIQQSRVLEVGCGLGFFTDVLARAPAREVVVIDISPTLISKLSRRHPSVQCHVEDIFDPSPTLGDRQFDLVLCSEVIEHTPDPQKAVEELCRRVAPGGSLLVSCPNRRWIWLLRGAQRFGLRKHYQGYENWVRPQDLKKWMVTNGLAILKTEGIHTIPWQCLPKKLLRFLDHRLRRWNYGWALNLAVMARRPTADSK